MVPLNRVLAILIGVMILLISFSATLSLIDRWRAESYFHHVESYKLNKEVYYPSEPMVVTITSHREIPTYGCISNVNRFIIKEKDDTPEVLWSEIVPSIAKNGIYTFSRTVRPPKFPDGEYNFKVEVVDMCSDRNYKAEPPPVAFRIKSNESH